MVFLVYRLVAALYAICNISATIILLTKPYRGPHTTWVFLTHWTYVVLTLHLTTALAITLRHYILTRGKDSTSLKTGEARNSKQDIEYENAAFDDDNSRVKEKQDGCQLSGNAATNNVLKLKSEVIEEIMEYENEAFDDDSVRVKKDNEMPNDQRVITVVNEQKSRVPEESIEYENLAFEDDRARDEEKPNEEIPNEEMPNKEMPNKEMPNKLMPNEEMPNEEMPNEEMPNEKMPNEEMPNEEMPNKEMPIEEMPNEEMPNEEMPNKEMPNEEMPNEEMPNEKIPNEEMPNEEMPNEEMPNKEMPNEKIPNKEMPNEEMPNKEMPNEEKPNKEMPTQVSIEVATQESQMPKETTVPMKWYMKLSWFLFSISAPMSLLVTVCYYISYSLQLANPLDGALTVIDINLHATNSVMVLLELFLGAYPVRVLHVIYPIIYGLIYVVFSVFYWTANPEVHVIYRVILDWNEPLISSISTVSMLVILLPLFHLLVFGMYQLRLWMYRKISCKA